MLPSIPTIVNQDNYLAIWLCLVRQTCYSCLVSNGEQRWGGENNLASHLCPINCKSPGKGKKCLSQTEPSLNFTSRGGVYIAGKGDAGGGVSACLGPSVVPLCFYVWGRACVILVDFKGYLASSDCIHSKQSKALQIYAFYRGLMKRESTLTL